jgi:2-polyprenyl-3-methyl-5-hydroxy-6-metoxy-1,4-benzoquinol methylase
MKPTQPTIDDVRTFWESNPLYSGESRHDAGTPEFFAAHEAMTISEHSGEPEPIFFRDAERGTRVLDVGCGIGFWTLLFARRGVAISACDLTHRGVALTRRRLALNGLDADVRQGNAESLPYGDGAFDHVNCQGVIHHTPDPQRCVDEFARVLRPGGTACFSVYYRTLPLRHPWLYAVTRRIASLLLRLPGRGREQMFETRNPEELVRFYDGAENPIGIALGRDDLRALVRGKFEILEWCRIGFPRKALPIPMPDALHRLLSRWFGLMIVVRCRKLSRGRA